MAEAATKIAEPAAKSEDRIPALTHSRFQEAGYHRNIFCVTVPVGTTVEQITHYKYWEHVAAMLKSGDRIEVMDDSNSFFLELFVIGAERLWAHVGVIRMVDLTVFHDQEKPIVDDLYDVNFAGAHHKWRVLYDGEEMKDGFETEGLARRWAANHSQARQR